MGRSLVAGLAKQLRDTAMADPAVICPWCGSRPADGRWEADHIAPILGVLGPMVVCCGVCNRRRQQKYPRGDQKTRLFWSDRVLRSCTSEQLRATLEAAAADIFGSEYWIDLLIAAVDGRKFVYNSSGVKDELGCRKLKEVGIIRL